MSRDELEVCTEVLNLLPDFARESLGPSEREAVLDHLEACPACREELEAGARVGEVLREGLDDSTPPEDFSESLQARLAAAVTRAPRPGGGGDDPAT